MKKKTFSLYGFIETRFADPLSSIGISEKYIIIGTLMGKIYSFSIYDKRTCLINELSTEYISGIMFDNTENYFYASVGDEEILKFETDSSNLISRTKNYNSDSLHNKYCENMYSLISKYNLLLFSLAPQEEGNVKINNFDSNCYIINFEDDEKINFTIQITNYSVPLDYNGQYILYIEFLSDKERNLCIKNVLDNNDTILKKKIDQNFGHISHCKIISDCNIFLVRNLNKCEIRRMNKDFTLIQNFKNIGSEVIAIDIFYKNNNNQNNKDERNNYYKNNVLKIKNNTNTTGKVLNKNSENEIIKANSFNNDIILSNSNLDDKKFNGTIAILDIDGNINFFENNIISKKFNLYDIKEINIEQKKKMFFSMGYAYYIKCNNNLICISTDHGCYIIKSN